MASGPGSIKRTSTRRSVSKSAPISAGSAGARSSLERNVEPR
jgi:hypothetical protein